MASIVKKVKQAIIDKPTIAYYSGYNGIEIKQINEDEVICVSGCFGSSKIQRVHCVKLYTDCKEPYFMISNHRIYLKDCLKV